jgi:lambda repressor-like predicted transcriptional regulator
VRLQSRAHDAPGALEALLAAEREAAGAYLAALSGLGGADARALATALYASGAQHEAIVLAALGRDPLPDAFAGSLT